MARPWWPLVENCLTREYRGPGVVPHFRVYRLVYTRFLDWFVIPPSKVRHLFWRFFWVRS